MCRLSYLTCTVLAAKWSLSSLTHYFHAVYRSVDIIIWSLLWLGQKVHTGGGKCSALLNQTSSLKAAKARTVMMTALTVDTQVYFTAH